MKWTANTPLYAVVDDFLSPADWGEIRKYLEYIGYRHVREGGWHGAWRIDDGDVMRGAVIGYGNFESPDASFPTHTGIDLLIEAVIQLAPQLEKQIGVKDKAWDAMTATPMLYPRGSSLYWHRDMPLWTGSYTYYAHPEWNIQWGGELLLAEDEEVQKLGDEYGIFFSKPRSAKGLEGTASFGAHIDNQDANEFMLRRGIGTYIQPKPNRLVVISYGTPHMVSKVHDAAGDRLRTSVSGFFQRPKK